MDAQMPSGLVIPSTLKYSLYRMIQDASISTNVLRLVPLNLQTVKSGGLISVRLPLATCSLPSFSMTFNNYISTYPTYTNLDSSFKDRGWDSEGVTGTYTNGASAVSFPSGLESLIQRLEIVVAGVSLMTLPNYNVLYNVLKDINQTLDHKVSRHIVEGEDDVVPNFQLGVTTVSNPVTCYNWFVKKATTSLTITTHCTSLESLSAATYTFNAPPASFFGFTGATAGAAYPQITRVAPRQVNIQDGGLYSAGFNYVIDLTYTCSGAAGYTASTTGSATGGTITENQIYSGYPFSFNTSLTSGATGAPTITPGASVGAGGAYSPSSESHTIRDFLGFFKAMPKAIQLAALGEVEIRLYLEQAPNVLVVCPPPQTLAQITTGTSPAVMSSSPDYTLTNIEFQIRTMSWDNGWLDSMMQSELAAGSTLEIPYPNYYSVVQGNQANGQTTTRFSVNTQNLRQVWSVNKPGLNYTSSLSNMQLYVPSGYGVNGKGNFGNTHKGFYFADTASFPSAWGSVPNDSGFNAAAQAATSVVNNVPNKWNYLINNQLIPNLQVSPLRTYAFTQELLDKEDWEEGNAVGNPMTYFTSGYAMGITLEYVDKYADESIRELFGLDTRSASSVFYLYQTNNRSGDTTYVFSIFTSVLRVAMNNQIQVVI